MFHLYHQNHSIPHQHTIIITPKQFPVSPPILFIILHHPPFIVTTKSFCNPSTFSTTSPNFSLLTDLPLPSSQYILHLNQNPLPLSPLASTDIWISQIFSKETLSLHLVHSALNLDRPDTFGIILTFCYRIPECSFL